MPRCWSVGIGELEHLSNAADGILGAVWPGVHALWLWSEVAVGSFAPIEVPVIDGEEAAIWWSVAKL